MLALLKMRTLHRKPGYTTWTINYELNNASVNILSVKLSYFNKC